MNRWINIVILMGLTACAATPEKSPELQAESDQPLLADVGQQQHHSAIDEEVLYLLMAAEMAEQRNQYYLAMDAYLQAAKLVDDPRIAERAVKIGLYLKDEKRTEEALAIWLTKDGKNLGARKLSVLLAIKNADFNRAVESLDVLLTEDPAGFESDILEVLKLFEKEGRTQFAYDVLAELDKRHPHHVQVLFAQAVLASLMRNNEQAQEKIDAVLKLQPDWTRAIIFQAQLSGRSGDLLKAREYLEKAVKQSPDDMQLRKLLLEVMVNTGAMDDAIRFCQKILDDKPDDGDTLFSLAMIYLQKNQIDKAENCLEKLVHKHDWSGKACFYLGKIELDKHHPEKALLWFDKVVDKNYIFDAKLAAISVLMNLKRTEELDARINKLEVDFPEQRLKVLLIKAEFLNQAGRYQQAFDVLSEALASDADNRDVLYARALIAEHLDKFDVLEADLRHILQKNPDDVAALNAIGYTLIDRNTRLDEAEKYLDQALKLDPDQGVIIDSYGWLQFKKGNLPMSLEYLRKAYANDPENEIAAHIAEVLWTMGNVKEAKEFFQSVYKKFPDDEFLLKFKNKFLTNEQN